LYPAGKKEHLSDIQRKKRKAPWTSWAKKIAGHPSRRKKKKREGGDADRKRTWRNRRMGKKKKKRDVRPQRPQKKDGRYLMQKKLQRECGSVMQSVEKTKGKDPVLLTTSGQDLHLYHDTKKKEKKDEQGITENGGRRSKAPRARMLLGSKSPSPPPNEPASRGSSQKKGDAVPLCAHHNRKGKKKDRELLT